MFKLTANDPNPGKLYPSLQLQPRAAELIYLFFFFLGGGGGGKDKTGHCTLMSKRALTPNGVHADNYH